MSYEEQIMFKDKYPSTFSPQMKAVVFFYPSNLLRNARSFEIGEYSRMFPSFS